MNVKTVLKSLEILSCFVFLYPVVARTQDPFPAVFARHRTTPELAASDHVREEDVDFRRMRKIAQSLEVHLYVQIA